MQKKLINLCRLILADKNTRNLFFFLIVNLLFAFVELTYGLLTNSLGLISDSFHMFFDCSALLLGLAASLVAKWKPSDKFTYGFGRAEILAGLANGLFLLFIALFIMKEAIERTFEPPEVHHERLFAISVLGFLVNLIGIFVFQHGGQGHHHHGGGSCSHSHSKKSKLNHQHTADYKYDNLHGYSHYASPTIVSDNNNHINNNSMPNTSVALEMNGYSNGPSTHAASDLYNSQAHNHNNHHHHDGDHNHHHHNHHHVEQLDEEPFLTDSKSSSNKHRGQIMQSVFLHIVADTLGSVGVMISAILMNQFGWMIADPLCSLFIAILISISVYPLLRDAIYILMQRVPVELERQLPDCLYKIHQLPGVLNVHETHFWTLNSDTYVGSIKLDIAPQADYRQLMDRSKRLLLSIGVTRAHIHIDYAP